MDELYEASAPQRAPPQVFAAAGFEEDRPTKRVQVLARLAAVRSDVSRRFGVRSLGLFGSAARDPMQPGSDIDILVKFDRSASFERYFGLKDHLESRLGLPVDLVTECGLEPRARQHVEQDLIRVP